MIEKFSHHPVFVLLTGVVIAGFGNALVRQASLNHPPLVVAFWVSFGILLGYVVKAKGRSSTLLVLKNIKTAASYVGIQMTAFLLFILAMNMGSVALVSAFFPIEIVVGTVLSVWILKEEMDKAGRIGLMLSLLGAVLVATEGISLSGVSLSAIGVSLAASVAYGLGIPMIRVAGKENASIPMLVWMNVCLVVGLLPFAFAQFDVALLLVFVYAVLVWPLGGVCYNYGVSKAPLVYVGAALPFLVVMSSLAGWAVSGEKPTQMIFVGGAVMALSSFLIVWSQERKTRRALKDQFV